LGWWFSNPIIKLKRLLGFIALNPSYGFGKKNKRRHRLKMLYNFYTMKKHLRIFVFFAISLSFGLSACSKPDQQLTSTAEPTIPAGATQVQVTETTAEIPASIPDCVLPLPGPQDWPVFICDTFDGTRHTFPTESQDNAYARYNAQLTDGQLYEVDYTAKGFAQFQRSTLTWFDIANAQDFALTISGTMNSTFKDVSWGIAFRGGEDKKSFFLFSLMNDGTYAFEIFENGGWISLISKRGFNGILLGEKNTLTVTAEGKNFKFLINGQPVEGFNGGLLEGMQVFLVVSAKEGASVVYSFDDLVMQI
jgi:hypothetical protein